MTPDIIIVGAGSAGCILAERLSADGKYTVLLLEAGPADSDPLIDLPKGFGKLLANPAFTHVFATTAQGETPAEYWVRGKTLGGSSAINGMMYFRGHPADYDAWVAGGVPGWGWNDMRPAFESIEQTLKISYSTVDTALTRRFIAAGRELGLHEVQDLNHADQHGIGRTPRTIFAGKRRSTARAFLDLARKRRNLTIETGVAVDRVLFEDSRAVGVLGFKDGQSQVYRCNQRVILSAGALVSPQILQRSGVGAASELRALGIPVIVDSPFVGAHLLEHRLLMMHYRLNRPFSVNLHLQGWRIALSALRYALGRRGPLAAGSYDVGAFFKTQPGLDRPDCELLMAPYGFLTGSDGAPAVPDFHSFHMFGYPLRARSEGFVKIGGATPQSAPIIVPNYLADPYDQQVTVRMFRFMRALVERPPMQDIIMEELSPGAAVQSDADIVHAFRTRGQAGYHACSTVRMGSDPSSPLDQQLRVKGTHGLLVVDGSALPSMPSSNTNGPIMALAWRAAAVILAGLADRAPSARVSA